MAMMEEAPKVFSVGTLDEDAFTADEIDLLVYKIRDWFASEECDRNYSDPLGEARAQVEQCLHATTKAGKRWRKVPEDFETRIKIRTLYDMEEGKHVSQQRAKTVEARANADHKRDLDAAKRGQGVNTATLAHLQQYQQNLSDDILATYPELDTPVHKPNVDRLALLYTEQERIRLELPGAGGKTRRDHIDTLSVIQKSVTDTMKALDIFPEQLRKRMDQQRTGSVGDLVATLGGDSEFKEREKRWSLTLALQLWWMTKHPNGKNTGPQIHDFEMWHLTRTRPINYTCKCGHEAVIVEGFTPEDLRDYLLENGVLVDKPILPQLVTEEDLNGLESYGQSTHEDEGVHGNTNSTGEISVEPDA